jgi:hypothetical protein
MELQQYFTLQHLIFLNQIILKKIMNGLIIYDLIKKELTN